MENECIFDLAFFLGVNYLSEHINKCTNEITSLLLQVSSSFAKNLKKIIESLVLVDSLENIASSLSISTNTTELLLFKVFPSGVCNICDKYFMRLQYHLRHRHKLPKHLVKAHSKLYKNDLYFYQPIDFKALQHEDSVNKNQRLPRKQAVEIHELDEVRSGMQASYFTTCSENSENILCMECGKIIAKENRTKHYAIHRRADNIECAKCGNKVCKRLLNSHKKTCGVSVSVAIESGDS